MICVSVQERGSYRERVNYRVSEKPYNPSKSINSSRLACFSLRFSCVKKSLTKTYIFAFLLNTTSHSKKLQYIKTLPFFSFSSWPWMSFT